MTTEAKTVEALRSKITTYLHEKDPNFKVAPDGKFHFRHGSTVVTIAPCQWNEQTLVEVFAPVALNISNVSPKLTRFLVEKNNELVFGKFSLDTEQKTVWYEHVLLGDFLDAEELYTAIAMVGMTADKYDEQVSEMARGKRVKDLKGG